MAMKYSEIKVQHIYYVNFDPVKDCEFDREHMAVVLKRNNDKKTFVVAPLTTSPNGLGNNKSLIGKISTLPDRLKNKDSYFVYDQVRTVNYRRFSPIYDNGKTIDCIMPEVVFDEILEICINEISINMTTQNLIKFHYDRYITIKANEIRNSAYQIKRIIKDFNIQKIEELESLSLKINTLWEECVISHLSEIDLNQGINEIINDCLNGTITEKLKFNEKIG